MDQPRTATDMSQAPSKCLSMWIKMNKGDNLKKPSMELKKIFLFWHCMNPSKTWSIKLEAGIFLAI